jgi:hypothetical protein
VTFRRARVILPRRNVQRRNRLSSTRGHRAHATRVGIAAVAVALGSGCHRRHSVPNAQPAASQSPFENQDERSMRHGTPCGALGCTQYDSPADAFLDAIESQPLVLGLGEAHAPKGAKVPSAARRFTEDLLPLLAGRASDLLLESMMPPGACRAAAVEARSKERIVTSHQAPTDQNEYLAMGERARTFGVVPDLLRPDCADIEAMRAQDGSDSIDATLEIIGRLTTTQAKTLVVRDSRSDADRGKMVVIYGGALHNDLSPRPQAARWSYAPALSAFVHGRFIALDLIVPEFIRDDDAWRALPWWPLYQPERLGDRSTLFRTDDHSFVLVFPRT